jgi:hypothetical protein
MIGVESGLLPGTPVTGPAATRSRYSQLLNLDVFVIVFPRSFQI